MSLPIVLYVALRKEAAAAGMGAGGPAAAPLPPALPPGLAYQRRDVVIRLIMICEDLGYDCATLAAAVTLLDRVLAVLPGAEEVLLPIGVACLRVCANLLEPRAASYADITYRYSHLPLMGVPAFRKLELNLLNNILGWDLTVFTALDMARTCLSLVPVPRIQAVLEPKIEIMHKLALLDHDLIARSGAPPSSLGLALVAAACEESGFVVSPLLETLAANGVPVPQRVDPALVTRLLRPYHAHMGLHAPPPPPLPPASATMQPGCPPSPPSRLAYGEGAGQPGGGSAASAPTTAYPTPRSVTSCVGTPMAGGAGGIACEPMSEEEHDDADDEGVTAGAAAYLSAATSAVAMVGASPRQQRHPRHPPVLEPPAPACTLLASPSSEELAALSGYCGGGVGFVPLAPVAAVAVEAGDMVD